MESGIEPSVDLDSLDERIKIREMILKGQIQEAIALINSLHPELLDTNRYLYFHLQVTKRASFDLLIICFFSAHIIHSPSAPFEVNFHMFVLLPHVSHFSMPSCL